MDAEEKTQTPEKTGNYENSEDENRQNLESLKPFSFPGDRKFDPEGPQKSGQNQTISSDDRKFSAEEGAPEFGFWILDFFENTCSLKTQNDWPANCANDRE